MAEQVVGRIVAEVGIKNNIGPEMVGVLGSFKAIEGLGKNTGSGMAAGVSNARKSIQGDVKSIEGSIKGLGTTASNALGTGLAGSVTKATGSILSASQQITKSIGFWGIAISGGISASIIKLGSDATSTFMKFDDQMRKVQAVTESTGSQFDKLTDQAKFLGATTSFTAQEAAEGMTLLGQAGFDANQVIAAMPATLNLARGSMTDLATTADIMSNIMNGFRIAAEDTTRVSDVLAKAANATNTDVTGLGNAMKYVAPLAYQMGWSLEETAAAAGLLSNAGIKSSMAGTVLRNAIARLISPTDEAVQILQKYGISMDMVNPKTHSLAQIIDTLARAGVSTGDIMEVFGMRAGPGMAAMMNIGSGAIEKMNQTLLNSGGYAQEAADKMDAGWGGAVRRLGDAVEALQLSFGKAIATIATPFLNMISAIMVGISRLPQPILMTATVFGGLAAAALGTVAVLGTLGIAVTAISSGWGVLVPLLGKLATQFTAFTVSGGTLGSVLGTIASVVGSIVPSFEGLSIAIGALVSPIGLAVTGIAAIGVSMLGWNKSIQLVKDSFTILAHFLSTIWTEIKYVVGSAIDWISQKITTFAENTGLIKVVNTYETAYSKMSGFLNNFADNVHERAENIRNDDNRIAESEKNVQTSIENANNGVIKSGSAVDQATGQSWASIIESAGGGAEEVVGANNEVISSNTDLVGSMDEVQKKAATPVKWSMEQTDVAGITNYDSERAIANNPLTASMDQLNSGLKLADGNTVKLNSSGEMVIETFDGIEKNVSDINESLNDGTKITDMYSSSVKQIGAGVKLANGNVLTLNSSGNLVLQTSDGIQKSLSKIQDSTEQSAAKTETYAASVEKVRNGIALADGNLLKLNSSGSIVIQTADGIEKSYSSIQKTVAKNTDESKKFAASLQLIQNGISLADGNMLKLNSSGQFVIETAYGIQTSFKSINSSTEKSTQQTKQYADSIAQLSQGIQLADGNLLKLNENNEVILQTADGVQRSYEDIKKAIDKSTDSSNNYAGAIAQISSGIQLADGSMLSLNSYGEATIKTVDGITKSVKDLQTELEDASSIAGSALVLSMDDLNKGIQLADGGVLKLNKDGETVVETAAGIQKKLIEIGTTSLTTADNKKIDVLVNPVAPEIAKKVGYTGESTAKTISLEESHKRAVGESEKELTPEEKRAQEHSQKTGRPTIAVKNEVESYYSPEELKKLESGAWKGKAEIPKTHGQAPTLSKEDQVLMYEAEEKKKLEHATPEPVTKHKPTPDLATSLRESREARGAEQQAPIALTQKTAPKKETTLEERKTQLQSEKNVEADETARKAGPLSYYAGKLGLPKLGGEEGKTTQFDIVKKQADGIVKDLKGTKLGDNSLYDIIFGNIKGTDKSASFLPSFDGISKSFDSLKNISFDGLIGKIKEIPTELQKSVSEIPFVKSTLETLDGISYDGLKTSVQGYVDSFTDSVSNIPGVQSVLDGLNGISYDGLKTSIQGYVDSFTNSASNIPGVQSVLETLNGISYDGLKTSIQGYVESFTNSASNIPGVQTALEGLNNISYDGLKTTIQGYVEKFTESVNNMPAVQTGLEILNSISYESFKTTIQGYADKFTETVNNMPTVKTGLEVLNSISYESLKTTIQGVIQKFWDTSPEAGKVKIAINDWNNLSFSTLTSKLSTLKSDLGKVVEAAQSMYNQVAEWASKAWSTITRTNNATGKSSGGNTTNNNVKIATINNNGTSISQNAMRLITYGGV